MTKKSTDKKRVVLLDAHAILHRAYHALPEFSAKDGTPTGALYGVVAMLLKIAEELSPEYIIACYDLPEPTYRHHAYEAYKAGRAKTDDALVLQIVRSREVCEAFGIPIYDAPGFEADDILGTIVEQTKEDKDIEIVIASGDMDTMQLVRKKEVQVYTLKKGIKDTILYDEAGVKERFGFPPKELPDFKGLRGDPSDNIPGVPGIGEKTATTLIQAFRTVEALYRVVHKNPEKLKEAGIRESIVKKLEENEEEAFFSKELATIRSDAPIHFALPRKTWREGVDLEKVRTLFDELSFRTLMRRVETLYGDVAETTEEKVEEQIDEALLSRARIALWLIDSDQTHASYEDILSYTKARALEEAMKVLLRELKEEHLLEVYEEIELPLLPVVERMEKRGVLIDVSFLKKLSKTFHADLSGMEKKIYEYAGGEEFNINSPKQLGEVLFDRLGLTGKNMKKTATGQRSTKESELAKLIGAHPIIETILQYREIQKLVSTYVDTIIERVDSENRLHAQFLQTGTTTGRMASQNPNLQNLPIRTEYGREIRRAVIAPQGFSILAIDYSQIELRIAAFLSGDEKLIRIFKSGGDVHTAVAAEVFGVPPEQVDSEMRRRAKVINFGILYGMGVSALQQNLKTTRSEAQQFYTDYFTQFSGIAHYVEKIKSEVGHRGYTTTFFGRKRHFAGIRSPLPYVKAQAERMAVNAPIQGTQADIIKIAMREIEAYIHKRGWQDKVFLTMQVHDELVFEVENEILKEVSDECTRIMEGVLSPSEISGMTLCAEAEAGENWADMEPLSSN